MPQRFETESRKLLGRLREALAADNEGQARLDEVVSLIANSMGTEVCSIYLFRDPETLELCATKGPQPQAVHQTRMRHPGTIMAYTSFTYFIGSYFFQG